MFTAKMLTMCASVVITAGSFCITAPPARAAQRPVYIDSNRELLVYRRISYRDLNLSHVEGQWTLNRRIHWAVRGMCAEAAGGIEGDIMKLARQRACGSLALDQARPQVAAAVQRARDIAMNGSSTIAAAAIVIAIDR
jgi:UrcA family protein